jgi:creatinine amidohydrolase
MTLPRLWSELGRSDIESGTLSGAVAVLPVAATEQHGPHLPLGVDSLIMGFFLAAVREALPAALPAVILPVQEVGCSHEHLAFPGTLSLPPRDAVAAWVAMGEGVARTGCRRIVLVSSHGGNGPAMELAAQDLRVRSGMVAVTTSWARLGHPPPPGGIDLAHDWHGGFVETSIMLAFRPDLVRGDRLADFPSRGAEMEKRFRRLRATRPAGFSWMAQDLNPEGALGDASKASAAWGRVAVDHGARAFVELLADVAAFDLPPAG